MAEPTPPVVVLGAGAPHRGTVPAALRGDRAGASVLDWTLQALDAAHDDCVFVAGYRVDAVRARYPDLRIVEQPDWRRTGSAGSLLVALEALGVGGADDVPDGGVLVCYGDVLLRPDPARDLRAGGPRLAAAWDSAWRERYAGRPRADLVASEKVRVADGRVVRLGYDLALDDASGEFVGLVRFDPAALATVLALGRRDRAAVARTHLSGLVALLLAEGAVCDAVDVAGAWAEVNEPGDIARFVLGTKADTLRRLRGPMRTARIADQVTFGVDEWNQDRAAVLGRIRAGLGEVALIVRSSTSHEDAFTASNAGGFTSVLGVLGPEALVEAVERVIASYRAGGIGEDDLPSQQVLVQPMITEVALSGVATTRSLEHGAPWRVVAFTSGADTSTVTAGTGHEQRTLVLHRGRARDAALPPAAHVVAPLLPVLDEVEHLLGHDRLDVEFAIDAAGTVHVLQVRPLVTPRGGEVADEAFAAAVGAAREALDAARAAGGPVPVLSLMTDWNPAEMIGTAPGALARSLYGDLITDEVWARQRAEYGYRDLRPAPLLRDLAGRPYVDVRLSLASFLPAALDEGLADRLLREALDRLRREPWRHDKVEFDLVATCLTPDFPAHAERLRAAGFTVDEVEQLEVALRRITRDGLARVTADAARVERLAAGRDRHASLPPAERAGRLLADARELGTLPFAHLARTAFVAVALLRGAVAAGALAAAELEALLGGVRTVGQELADDVGRVAAGALDRDALVRRWGHLRPGTYDITSPRYDSDPVRFLDPLVARAVRAGRSAPTPSHGSAWDAARPVARLAAALRRLGVVAEEVDDAVAVGALRAAIEGREWAKFEFTHNLSDALEALVAAWGPAGLDREQLAELPLALLLSEPDAATAARLDGVARSNAAQRAVTSRLELPPVVTGPEDLEAFVLAADVPNFVGSLRVVAPVVGPEAIGAEGADVLEGAVVLLPSADPGFDWLFGHGIAGLITLYGGANSHMTIRAAEFGLSAAIGVGEQRYRELAGASLVELDPAGRTVRRLS